MEATNSPALMELQQQLAVAQDRLAAKENSSRKYKEAVRALKVRAPGLGFQGSTMVPAEQEIGAWQMVCLGPVLDVATEEASNQKALMRPRHSFVGLLVTHRPSACVFLP